MTRLGDGLGMTSVGDGVCVCVTGVWRLNFSRASQGNGLNEESFIPLFVFLSSVGIRTLGFAFACSGVLFRST